ncbi:MAG: hypothetical protein SF051_00445 [Elusimicrobiota bacterium]|nr:hypothetical protein [Elusimicrobiota bacterium]
MDRRGRVKETRHGTRHFTTWRPARPGRAVPSWVRNARRTTG